MPKRRDRIWRDEVAFNTVKSLAQSTSGQPPNGSTDDKTYGPVNRLPVKRWRGAGIAGHRPDANRVTPQRTPRGVTQFEIFVMLETPNPRRSQPAQPLLSCHFRGELLAPGDYTIGSAEKGRQPFELAPGSKFRSTLRRHRGANIRPDAELRGCKCRPCIELSHHSVPRRGSRVGLVPHEQPVSPWIGR